MPFPPQARTTDKAHGRLETRELWASSELNGYVDFPHVGQVLVVRRTVLRGRAAVPTVETSVGITSLTAERASGKTTAPDQRRFYAIARGSAMECGAIVDACLALGPIEATRATDAEQLLSSVVRMLSKMCRE